DRSTYGVLAGESMTGTLERTQGDFSEPWGNQHTGCWLWLGRFASVRGREPLKLSNSNHPRNSIGMLAIKKPEIFGGFDFFALDQVFEASANDWNLFHKAPFHPMRVRFRRSSQESGLLRFS